MTYHRVSSDFPDPIPAPFTGHVNLMVPVSEKQVQAVVSKKTVLKKGDAVQQGQLLDVFDGPDRVLCSATGKVASLDIITGVYAHKFMSIAVEPDEEGETGQASVSVDDILGTDAGIWALIKMLPGLPSPNLYRTTSELVHTLVISGSDMDLFMLSNQYAVLKRTGDLSQGIAFLKEALPDKNIVLVVPEYLEAKAQTCGVSVHTTQDSYPSTNRRLLEKKLNPGKKRTKQGGFLFLSAEAISCLGAAVTTKTLPVEKVITVTGKDGKPALVSARVGTSVHDVMKAAGHEIGPVDHIIYGGPFTGTSIYSGDIPVMSDTDALILEDHEDIPMVSTNYCINCGSCIRSCPVNIPVNLLIRVLEVRDYQRAETHFGLKACVECGLCGFICPAGIPVFQHIKLARQTMLEKKLQQHTGA